MGFPPSLSLKKKKEKGKFLRDWQTGFPTNGFPTPPVLDHFFAHAERGCTVSALASS